jgi:hypothetical protein
MGLLLSDRLGFGWSGFVVVLRWRGPEVGFRKQNSRRELSMTATRNSFKQIAFATSFTLILLGCNGNGNAQNSGLNADRTTESRTQDQTTVIKKMNKKEQIAFAQKNLAERLGVDPGTVSLSGAKSVTWRSSALGCPEQGMNYMQALVPGIRIMLHVGNTSFRYHAKSTGQPFYCPDQRAESPVKGSGAD